MLIPVILPEGPEGNRGQGHPIPSWLLVTSVVSVILTTGIYIVIFFGGSGFEDLYQGFGAELPTLTRFVFASYRFYGVFVLIGLVPTVFLIKSRACFVGDRNRLFIPMVASFGLAMFILGVFVVAMYMPIFAMGSLIE